MSNALATLQQDLACPACGYNLRGLPGPVVSCPECGHRCDLAEMLTRRWTRPWYMAPFFNQLMYPVAVASLGPLVGLPVTLGCAGAFSSLMPHGLVLAAVLLLAVFAAWSALLVWVWRRWPGPEGVALSLLGHVVLIGYSAGVITIIVTLLIFVFNASVQRVPSLLLALLAGGVVYAARRGERFIAGRCIRRYLMRG